MMDINSIGLDMALRKLDEVTAQRDELLLVLKDLEVASNTVSGCYTRNPANFASALNMMDDAAETARTAIAKCEVQS